MIKQKYFCFLWIVYYRWQTYISLYASLWPGDHGYSSIPPQKEIHYPHFENCSTNAFPKTSVIALVLPSYLGIHSPFLIFPFALFQHLPNHSFFICCLRGSAHRNVESHKWLSFKWRNSAWDPTDCQEETLLFLGAIISPTSDFYKLSSLLLIPIVYDSDFARTTWEAKLGSDLVLLYKFETSTDWTGVHQSMVHSKGVYKLQLLNYISVQHGCIRLPYRGKSQPVIPVLSKAQCFAPVFPVLLQGVQHYAQPPAKTGDFLKNL